MERKTYLSTEMQECDFARSTLVIHGFSGCDIPRKYSNSVISTIIHIVLILNIKDIIICVLLNDDINRIFEIVLLPRLCNTLPSIFNFPKYIYLNI